MRDLFTPCPHRAVRALARRLEGHPGAVMLALFVALHCRETGDLTVNHVDLPHLGHCMDGRALRHARERLVLAGVLVPKDGGGAYTFTARDVFELSPGPARVSTGNRRGSARVSTGNGSGTAEVLPRSCSPTSNESGNLAPPHILKETVNNKGERESKSAGARVDSQPSPAVEIPAYVSLPRAVYQAPRLTKFPESWKPGETHVDYAQREWGFSAQDFRACWLDAKRRDWAHGFSDPSAHFLRCLDWYAERKGMPRRLMATGRAS